MELSQSIPKDFSCPSCTREFTFDVWIIVDVVERPELGFRIERGRLHHVSCPYCQTEMGIQDVPLLIYRPHSPVRIIYSKPKFATDEQSQSFFNELMSQLQVGVDDSIQLEGIVATVNYEELPEFLDSEIEVMRRVEYEALQAKPIEERWPYLFRDLFTLPTRRRTREYIEQHPDLLTGAALHELDRLIESTGDSETAEMMRHYRDLLAGCREKGIEAAVADATEMFYEDEILEPFDDFGLEVLSVVSALAQRGLSLQPRPNRSQSDEPAPDTQFPAPLLDKLNRAFNISVLVKWSREPAVIESTISAWQSVIKDSHIQSFPRQHAAAWDALGDACVSACRDFGQRRWANLAVEAGENASRLTVGEADKWACCMANLGLALHARFEATGELADINRAAQVFGEALAVIDRTHMDWAAMKSNLAMVLIRRYEAIGELADLNEAILSTREVLEVFPQNEMAHSMLAMALSRRFEALKQKSDIDDAIKHYQQSLAAVNKESNDWSKAQNNLGLALMIRFEVFADASDLDHAIESYRAAVQVTHENTPDWAIPTANLGVAAIRRFQLSGNAADLDESIVTLKKAISSTQVRSGDWALWVTDLGSAYYLKSQHGDAGSLDEAIATYSLILEQLSPNEQPGIVLMVARSLGRIRFDRSEWEQSSESYRIAIEGLNALYRNQLMLAGREAWLTKAGDIYRYAAYALAKAGRTEEAIVTMEQGRGRGLRVALARDRTNLTKIRELNPALYNLYESAAARLRQLEARERFSWRRQSTSDCAATKLRDRRDYASRRSI
jgi:tetratricopeptide (TPR) repeat protein